MATTEKEQKDDFLANIFKRIQHNTLSVDFSLLLWIIAAVMGGWVMISQKNLVLSATDISIYAFEFVIAVTILPLRSDGYRFSYEGLGIQNRKDRIRKIALLVLSIILAVFAILVTGATFLEISQTSFVATTETLFFGLWLPNIIIVVFERIPIIKRLGDLQFNKTKVIFVIVGEILAQFIFMWLHAHKYTGRALWSVFFLGLLFNGLSFYFPGLGVTLHFVNNLFALAT